MDYYVKITEELGKGYSSRHLRDMRHFYLEFKNEKWRSMVAKLTWSHICKLLPIKDEKKRIYYINQCVKNNLGKRELGQIIKNNEYERLPESTKNKLITKKEDKFVLKYVSEPNIFITKYLII